jgi:hypothetical protein
LEQLLTPEKIAKDVNVYHIKNWQFYPKACSKTNRVLEQAHLVVNLGKRLDKMIIYMVLYKDTYV